MTISAIPISLTVFHVSGVVHGCMLEALAIIHVLKTSLHTFLFFLQFNVSRLSQSSDW